MPVWVFSSRAGFESTQNHHFLMDYDKIKKPKICAGETAYRTTHGWHIIQELEQGLTKEEYKLRLYDRKADPSFILSLELRNEAHLDCPENKAIRKKFWHLMRLDLSR